MDNIIVQCTEEDEEGTGMLLLQLLLNPVPNARVLICVPLTTEQWWPAVKTPMLDSRYWQWPNNRRRLHCLIPRYELINVLFNYSNVYCSMTNLIHTNINIPVFFFILELRRSVSSRHTSSP